MEKITIIVERKGEAYEFGRTAEKLTNGMILAFLEKAPRILDVACTCKDAEGCTWSCDCPQHGTNITKSKGGQS